jgi:hypothetical protein
MRHPCASCAPVRPEANGFSRIGFRLNKRNRHGHAGAGYHGILWLGGGALVTFVVGFAGLIVTVAVV